MVWNVHPRKLTAALAVISATAILAAACSSGSGSTAPSASAAASATSGAEEPGGVPESLVGLHIVGVEGGAWASAPFGSLRLWDNGTGWSQIELEKGVFKWDNLEGALSTAESKGVSDVLMVLGTTPEWAASDTSADPETIYPPYPGANTPPKNLEDWDNWVRTVATRYKGRISAYQVWNEASYTNFWSGTPEEMAELTARAYKIVKEVDPDALVVSASPALRLAPRYQKFFPAYLDALAAKDWPVDVLAVHTYPAADGDPSDRGALLEQVKKDIAAAGAPADLPLWDTELNYGLAGPGDLPRQEITGARAAGFVVRTYIDDLRYGVARSYWYIYTQTPYDLLGVQAFPGSDGEQGFFALDDWVRGAALVGDACTESGNAVICDFTRGGNRWQWAWAQTGEAPYTTPEGALLVCDPLANCQDLDPQAAGGSQIVLTEVPVRIQLP